jgi:integrase
VDEYSALDATVTISTQLTEVDWEVVEGDPKSEAGERVIPLDDETNRHFQTRKARHAKRRLELGPAWVDSGRVFTLEDGSALRPSSISDRFERLYKAARLPPIRLHDLRHTAATLMLAAKIDLKVIQETLGHSQIQTTANLYTSVLPKVARDAAEKTTALIPRAPARAPTRTLGHPSGTHKINTAHSEVREMTGA